MRNFYRYHMPLAGVSEEDDETYFVKLGRQFGAEAERSIIRLNFFSPTRILFTHCMGYSHLVGENNSLSPTTSKFIRYCSQSEADVLMCRTHLSFRYRGVKPANILLDENLVAKLADLGVSKEHSVVDTHISTMLAAGLTLG